MCSKRDFLLFIERIKERYWEANRMDEKTEKAYSPKEMFITLDIGDSTLRKWCIALEKNGYEFIRNEKKSRVYVENDLVVLRHFQNLIKQHNMQLDNAAILVIDRFGKGAFEASTVTVPAEKEEKQRDLERSNSEDIKELKQLVMKQNELIKDLINRMAQQQKYIDDSLNRRDERLTKTIEESMETRKLIATAENERKSFWNRLFGK